MRYDAFPCKQTRRHVSTIFLKVLFEIQTFLQQDDILAPSSITPGESDTSLRCPGDQAGGLPSLFLIVHSEQYEKQEESCDANGGCWQVIINVAPVAFSGKGPCTSHSIILLTRSPCKCGVLFKGYPSVINNGHVPCLFSLSKRLRGHSGTVASERKKRRVLFKESCTNRDNKMSFLIF